MCPGCLLSNPIPVLVQALAITSLFWACFSVACLEWAAILIQSHYSCSLPIFRARWKELDYIFTSWTTKSSYPPSSSQGLTRKPLHVNSKHNWILYILLVLCVAFMNSLWFVYLILLKWTQTNFFWSSNQSRKLGKYHHNLLDELYHPGP